LFICSSFYHQLPLRSTATKLPPPNPQNRTTTSSATRTIRHPLNCHPVSYRAENRRRRTSYFHRLPSAAYAANNKKNNYQEDEASKTYRFLFPLPYPEGALYSPAAALMIIICCPVQPR
jgi:hypothetical protein